MTRKTGEQRQGEASWFFAKERGSRFILAFVVWCIRHAGHAPLRVLVAPIAAYYTLFAPTARRASLSYLSRVTRIRGDRPPGLLDAYRHFHEFAAVILDRLAIWSGAIDRFEVVLHGKENIEELVEKKSGALLIGAHLGCLDVLRVLARDAGIPVNVVRYGANAERINETFQALDPDSRVRIIDLDPTSVQASFEIRRCVARGEFVAVQADRVRPGPRERITHANLLGELAPFPEGPILLAILLRIPVVLTFALRKGPRAYDIYLETLAGAEPVPPQERQRVVRERVEAFASRIEHHCLRSPYQWFNFYDFWGGAEDGRR